MSTTVILPNGDAYGSPHRTPNEEADRLTRLGWTVYVIEERVYASPGEVLRAHIMQAERNYGRA